jgi:hypothetical protein
MIKSKYAEHLFKESDLQCANIYLLNNFSGHIRQLGYLLNASSELSERVITYLKQTY